MPMFFISLVIGGLVAFYWRRLVHNKSLRGLNISMGLMASFVVLQVGFIMAAVIPGEYVLIEKYEIVPIQLLGQKYFVVPASSKTDYSFLLIKDLNGKIRMKNLHRVIEEPREDGVLMIYRNQSKTYRILSCFSKKKSEAHIPISSQLKIQ